MFNFKKILSISFVGILAIGILSSCGTKKETTSQENNDIKNTVIVTHSKGEATVVKNPKKAVVFDMGVLDTIDALDVETSLSLPISSLPSKLQKYKETAKNAGGIKEPDMEAIFEFKPDVIFISGRQEDYYDELNKIAPTIYVDLESKTYIDDFKRNVTYIAEIFSKEQKAQAGNSSGGLGRCKQEARQGACLRSGQKRGCTAIFMPAECELGLS